MRVLETKIFRQKVQNIEKYFSRHLTKELT